MDQCLNQSLLYRKNQENQEIAWFFTKTYKVKPCFLRNKVTVRVLNRYEIRNGAMQFTGVFL